METYWGYQSGAGCPYAYSELGANEFGIQNTSYYNEDILHKVCTSGIGGGREHRDNILDINKEVALLKRGDW